MIISCPNCATRYSISASVLGDQGRTVRCSHCGTSWHQEPRNDEPRPSPRHVAPPSPPPAPAYAYPPPPPGYFGAPYPYPPPGYPPPGYPPPGYPPQPGYGPYAPPQPQPQPPPARPAYEPEPPRRAPEPLIEDEPEPMPEPVRRPAPAAAPDETLSREEIESMFGDDAPPAMDSFIGNTEGRQGDDALNPDDIPDPEPIPEVFPQLRAPRDDDDRGGRGGLWLLTLIPLFLVVGLLAGAYFGRDWVISVLPEAAQMYKDLGLREEKLGAGLEIRVSGSQRINNEEGIAVTGVIYNVSDTERPVPQIKVVMRSLEGDPIQSSVIAPAKPVLPPGDQFPFRVEIAKLAPPARKMEVTFTTPEIEAKAGLNPAGR